MQVAPRKSLSLTRARRSGPVLSVGDHLRAAIFAGMARTVISTVTATLKVRTHGEGKLAGYRRLGQGRLLFAMWHGDFLPIMHYAQGNGIYVIVSSSPDGEILHRVLGSYGYRTVRGSNRRRGLRSMVELAKVVRHGADAAIAVDGPKGPALVAKAGIVAVARLTGCPIVPLGAAIDRYKQFASWDSFRFPLPFARVVLTAGDPIVVARHAPVEPLRRELQAALMAARSRAERLLMRFQDVNLPRGFASTMV